MSEASSLMTLQDLDLKLLRCASTLAAMPQQARLKTIALARKKVSSELTQILGQRKDAQIEVEDLEAALAHYAEKTQEVQAAAEEGEHTHRDVMSIEQQLTSLAKHTEKAEFTLVSSREKLERLERAERNANATLERIDAERESCEKSLADDTKSLRQEIVELTRERERVCASISAEHLAAYDVARKRFKGLAVERLHGNVPTVCRVRLQPSLFHDLAHGDEITTCPYCHRILVTTEEGEE